MLYQDFFNNVQKPIHKWLHYFPIYERHFKKFINQSIVVWEIGVFRGGSLQMWKKYFGPFAQIVGVDIDPTCKEHEEIQVSVHIGDQSDTVFLQTLVDKYGPPDIVLDDGSHIMKDVNTTFNFLYDKLSDNGVYIVEDMHTAYWESYGGGLCRSDSFIEHSKNLIDELNARHYNFPTEFADSTFSICFYDSVVVFEKVKWRKDSFQAPMIPAEITQPTTHMASDAVDIVLKDTTGQPLPCISFIEPALKNDDEQEIIVKGWCLSGYGVLQISVLIDNQFFGYASYGILREDVFDAYPNYKNHYSGFVYKVPFSELASGEHKIKIGVLCSNIETEFSKEYTIEV